MKNKYIKVTHIYERKTREIIRFYHAFRERIVDLCDAEAPFEDGEAELYESYFGSHRVRGKRGCGAAGKTPVFGMLKRGDRV